MPCGAGSASKASNCSRLMHVGVGMITDVIMVPGVGTVADVNTVAGVSTVVGVVTVVGVETVVDVGRVAGVGRVAAAGMGEDIFAAERRRASSSSQLGEICDGLVTSTH
jgi:hypothetical protein